MNIKSLLLSLSIAVLGVSGACAADGDASFRFVGGDISLLPDYESAEAQYKDGEGRPIADVLKFCYDEGMNCMRVRLFVNPSDYTGSDKDANAKQDIDYILPLCKRIKEDGFALLLDFHYSDTWADPAKQWTPKAWEGLAYDELYQTIYSYTKESLQTLKDAGAEPDFIQPGNEISYGMLWGPYNTKNPLKVYPDNDANWDRFGRLLGNAIKACREVCPAAGIIIHNERVAALSVLLGFYRRMKEMNVDYDIIGLSYYPYFHGSMTVLDSALSSLSQQFPEKDIMIVETGYSYAWEVPGTTEKVDYPYTEEGQAQFAKDLVALLLKYEKVTGLFWWWMEYNAYGTSLTGWYNAPLFNSLTGKVTPALHELCAFGSGPFEPSAVERVEAREGATPDAWFDLQGRRIAAPSAPGLYISGNRKILVK